MRENIIMRPVYNRPEMLHLSLEYEKQAREYFGNTDQLKTLFVVEHGAPDKTLELVDKYSFRKEIIYRKKKLGLTVNILEGMKKAFSDTSEFVIYIEDDILIHKTYFNYMKMLLGMFGSDSYSVLSSYNKDDNGDVHEIYKGHHYAALAPLINKKFFDKYILKCAIPEYYKNRSGFVIALNNNYKEHWGKLYKYRNAEHNEQAGLINRLVDVAAIEQNAWVIMPRVNRHMHIGFYGKNRIGSLPGKNFEERLELLKQLITSGDKMYSMTNSKEYNDYKTFSIKLDSWDGELYLKKK
jgi:hypothetical protein